MKAFVYLIIGVIFGIIMTKSEAVSWYRIQEMFRFESFHMYGIIGTAVLSGILVLAIAKRRGWTSTEGKAWRLNPKHRTVKRYLFGGTIFGLGWAMTGACPGPMFTLIGHGVWSILIVIASATLGTFVYGLLRDKLPH